MIGLAPIRLVKSPVHNLRRSTNSGSTETLARMKAKKADAPPPTTSQRLGSLLKSARDIMRKDKGLNGDLDRLPLLTWLMFLKFLDDHEADAETKAKLARKTFRPVIDPPTA